ncbi:helix-turn-helix domain-containing protein [uncultured Deefgea sp.]|uniref:helix-turn-helix domain-containing protein n=1 Tax=uncultured Deefgea sp. TaxID=1304914 RepID=UPI002592B68B|nr:helix-turn-helix domain-containing protein [uncultured Deefgea sp.]
MDLIDVGELSKLSGVSVATLRYYEEKGLIRAHARHGLRRQYQPETLTRLSLIHMGKSAGFTLDEVKQIFSPDGEVQLPRDALLKRADDINEQIARLANLGELLRHVADCSAPNHLACTRFQVLMKLATPNPTKTR